MSSLYEALGIVLTFDLVGLLAGAVAAGILVGAAPGLTSTIAIGLLIPFTFGLTKYHAFALLLGIYCGAMYGGSIPAVLMNLPGTPTSAVTAIDGHPMVQKGKATDALALSVFSSAAGGLISCVFLVFLSIQLSFLATAFAAPEYFALCVFALAVVFSMATKSVLKGVIATGLGLLVATIGVDPIAPYARFTFGVPELLIGIPEVPATIGLFCVAEAIRLISQEGRAELIAEKSKVGIIRTIRIAVKFWRTIIKSGLIGTLIGILPGAGATMASLIAYGVAQKSSKEPETFGTGNPEGVAASESANNSVTGGALIPMMTLGIPGDVNTLMLLGAMLVHGLVPGPALFREETTLVYVIFLAMILANFFILIIGSRFAPMVTKVAQVDRKYLVPVILLLAITGPAISEGHIYYFWLTIAFGIFGYVLEAGRYSVLAVAMGIILGPIIERNLRATLMLPEGFLEAMIFRPFCLVFLALSIILILFGLRRDVKQADKINTPELG